jgi:hypothetical protein
LYWLDIGRILGRILAEYWQTTFFLSCTAARHALIKLILLLLSIPPSRARARTLELDIHNPIYSFVTATISTVSDLLPLVPRDGPPLPAPAPHPPRPCAGQAVGEQRAVPDGTRGGCGGRCACCVLMPTTLPSEATITRTAGRSAEHQAQGAHPCERLGRASAA